MKKTTIKIFSVLLVIIFSFSFLINVNTRADEIETINLTDLVSAGVNDYGGTFGTDYWNYNFTSNILTP